MLHAIESDTPFDMIFLDFGEPGGIPDRYVSLNIITCLDFMTVFGVVTAIGVK